MTHLLAFLLGLTAGYVLAVADRRAALWDSLDGFFSRVDQLLADLVSKRS